MIKYLNGFKIKISKWVIQIIQYMNFFKIKDYKLSNNFQQEVMLKLINCN